MTATATEGGPPCTRKVPVTATATVHEGGPSARGRAYRHTAREIHRARGRPTVHEGGPRDRHRALDKAKRPPPCTREGGGIDRHLAHFFTELAREGDLTATVHAQSDGEANRPVIDRLGPNRIDQWRATRPPPCTHTLATLSCEHTLVHAHTGGSLVHAHTGGESCAHTGG